MLRLTRTQRSVLICHLWHSSFSSALNFLSLIPAGPGHETGPSHRQSITEPPKYTRLQKRNDFLGPKEQSADRSEPLWVRGNPAPPITIQAANLIELHQFWQEKCFKTFYCMWQREPDLMTEHTTSAQIRLCKCVFSVTGGVCSCPATVDLSVNVRCCSSFLQKQLIKEIKWR